MKIKLKKGVILEATNNLWGLSLNDFYKLQAGKTITVAETPKILKSQVDEIKETKKGGK